MPRYNEIETIDDPKIRLRVAGTLLRLRRHLKYRTMQRGPDKGKTKGVPPRSQNTLLLATWNIREFDSSKYGFRPDEPYFYIAEIISRFDLIAIQEIRSDLKALKRLTAILGPAWKYIVTDVTEGTKGNQERLAFLYDTRKVQFSGVAGQVVIPDRVVREGRRKVTYSPSTQLARTPFIVGFQSGWYRFMVCSVHILYGSSKANDKRRVKEIEMIVDFLKKRSQKDSTWSKNLILLGDFNIFNPSDLTFAALEKGGFEVPKGLLNKPANVNQTKHYDQIAFNKHKPSKKERDSSKRLWRNDIVPEYVKLGDANVFNFFESVYRDRDEAVYKAEMGDAYETKDTEKKRKLYYNRWRTFQMSDHLPMWIELRTDFAAQYLLHLYDENLGVRTRRRKKK